MNGVWREWLRQRPRTVTAGALATLFFCGWILSPPTPAPPARAAFPWSDPATVGAAPDVSYDARPLFRRQVPNARSEAAERLARIRAEREAEKKRSWRYGGLFRLEDEAWRVVVLRPTDDEPQYLAAGDLLPDGSHIAEIDARGVWVVAPDGARTRYGQPETP